MITKLKALFAVLKKGEAVTNPATWKNRQIAVNAVTLLLVAVAEAVKSFGVDLGVTEVQIESAVYGGASIFALVFNVWATFATSDKVGIGGETKP